MVSKVFLVVLGVGLLNGCGGIPSPLEPFESVNGCLGPYTAESGLKLNPDALARNELLLKKLFTSPWTDNYGTHEPILKNEREFCDEFGGVHITFKNAEYFPCGGSDCSGLTNAQGIFLEHYGYALLHELIHEHEWQHFIFNTGEHPGWYEKGYWYLGDTIYYSSFDENSTTRVN